MSTAAVSVLMFGVNSMHSTSVLDLLFGVCSCCGVTGFSEIEGVIRITL